MGKQTRENTFPERRLLNFSGSEASPRLHAGKKKQKTKNGSERALGWEGCLSVPGLRGVVPRHLHIRYRWQTLDGATVEREAAGFHARVVQHECDHLDGILYPQRMTDHRLLVFVEELQRHPIDLAAFLAGDAEP